MSVESVSWAWESSAVRVEKNVVAVLACECRPLASPTPSDAVGAVAALGTVVEASVDFCGGVPVSCTGDGRSCSAGTFVIPASVTFVVTSIVATVGGGGGGGRP